MTLMLIILHPSMSFCTDLPLACPVGASFQFFYFQIHIAYTLLFPSIAPPLATTYNPLYFPGF